MKNTFKLGAAAFAVAAAFCSTAYAAGFQLTEQSAGAMGRAYAGVGVDGKDLSGVYYNPATMVLHPGTQFQAGVVGIALDLEFEGSDNGHNVSENGRKKGQPIPAGYLTHQIDESMWIGLGMTVPFGMGTEYDKNWAHANRGISATVLTYDFNPNVAWKVNEKFSVGAGVSIQYASADLRMQMKAGDSEAANQAITGILPSLDLDEPTAAALAAQLSGLPLDSELDVDSWAWGWNIGFMWSPVENFRLGVSYRSAINHHADGDLTITPLADTTGIITKYPQLGTVLGQLMGDLPGSASLSTPAWAMVNTAWDVNSFMSLYATFRWTDWSSFDELKIESAGKHMANIVNKWKDTYLFSVGADFRMNDWWTLRTGVGYETSPIDKAQYRTAIIPDSDRLWLAAGSSFKVADNLQLDLSAAWLHGVGESDVTESQDSAKKVGEFEKLDAYLIGAQMVYKF